MQEMINFEIVLPNKDPFQIKNHVQGTHLHILYIYERRRSKCSKNKLFPPYLDCHIHGELLKVY